MQRITFAFILLCTFFFIDMKQVKGEASVQLDVKPGFHNEYKGKFIPVDVRISSSSDIQGHLRVKTSENRSQFLNENINLRQSIVLTAGTTKKVTFLLPNDPSLPKWKIVFEKDNKIMANEKIGGIRLSNESISVGVLSDDSQTISLINQMFRGNKKNDIRVYSLNSKDFPDKSKALSGLDILIYNHVTQDKLSSSQAKAVQRWVADGGKLIVGGGHHVDSLSKDLKRILPVKLSGKTTQLSHPQALSPYGTPPKDPIVISKVSLKKGGQSLLKSGKSILLAKRHHHQGKVIFVSYDLAAAPMNQWSGNQKLWNALHLFDDQYKHDLTGKDKNWDQPKSIDIPVRDIPEIGTPNLFWLALFFGFYLVLVGPVLYGVFALRKKREWVWIGVPIMSLAFGVLIFFYGHLVRGNEVVVHHTGYLETDREGLAKLQGMSSLVSLDQGDYSLKLQDTFAWPLDKEEQPLKSNDGISLFHQKDTSILFKNVSRWTKKDIFIDTTRDIGGDLQAKLFYQDGKLQGKVANQTKLPFKDVRLFYGDRYFQVGKLQPGETKTVVMPMQNYPSYAGKNLENLDDIYTGSKEEIFQYALETNDVFARSPFHVVAWSDAKLVKSKVKDEETKNPSLFLVFGDVHVLKNKRGGYKAPYGVIQPKLLYSDAIEEYQTYSHKYQAKTSGYSVFEYSLKPAKLTKITKLHVREMKNYHTSSNRRTNMEIYNWKQNQWTSTIGIQGGNLNVYLSKSGQIRIRIKTRGYESFQAPELTVEGR